MLSETFKQVVPPAESMMPADLPSDLEEDIGALARRAFEVLGLRDYARFDLRLTQSGTPFFLEANVTPSLEVGEAFARSAQWAGLDYPALIERLLSSAQSRYSPVREKRERLVTIELPTGLVNLVVPAEVHGPPPSSIDLAKLLDVHSGETVLDLGCGSGFLSIAAAKLGAKQVVAIDIDPRALAATVDNAQRNGVHEKIQVLAGSWFEALREWSYSRDTLKQFDVIIATPPQTPGTRPFGQRYGGLDGTSHLFTILDQAPTFLDPNRGRLWMLAISLADPIGLWQRLEEGFLMVSLVHETQRFFTPDEYESMDAGLFTHLLHLRSSGRSQFYEASNDRWFFRNLFIRAGGPRNTMKRLIINADDLGADEARNTGIFEGIQAGTVTSASILPNGPELQDALKRIHTESFRNVSWGVHLNLSEGKPVSTGNSILLGPNGMFLGKSFLTAPADAPGGPGSGDRDCSRDRCSDHSS